MTRFREQIVRLKAYEPGRQPPGRLVKLNANENPYPPAPGVLEALAALGPDDVRLYPDAAARLLRARAAKVFGVTPAQVVAGNGSDDILTMIVRSFLDPGDRIAVVDPTYTLYETLAAIQGATTTVHPLGPAWSLPASFFGAAVKVTFLPNPNAQTGTLFSRRELDRLCASARGMVVIDEAYAPFAGVTAVPLLREHGNLIVMRTLSKSHSLAGLRVGFGIGRAEIIAGMTKVKDSYNVSVAGQAAARAALDAAAYTSKTVAALVKTRTWFCRELDARGWCVVPSSANFLLAEPPAPGAAALMVLLERDGYLVRYFTTPRLHSMLRISMGTDAQMRGLLACIDRWCSRSPGVTRPRNGRRVP